MCLNCGSFGKTDEGTIIACSQCGQCFHNYCAGITNVCNVVLEKGWRCLDCTVCEGCGKATDESRLLLCDDCDISYHIYCLNPPLDQVPQGNWKCKWCVRCLKCNSKTPGKNSEWHNNYTECGLCYSLKVCHVCRLEYKDSDVLIKCSGCEKWSHSGAHSGNCKISLSEEDVKQAIAAQDFFCAQCQKDKNEELKKKSKIQKESLNDSNIFLQEIAALAKRGNLDEGIYLTDMGANIMKKLKIKPNPSFRRKPKTAASTSSAHVVETSSKQNHIHDEGSRSSSEERMIHDEIPHVQHSHDSKLSESTATNAVIAKSKAAPSTKRQINFGLGGFNPKARTRNRPHNDVNASDANAQLNLENESKVNKRVKKKSVLEEMIPVYMQEAFFGASTLSTLGSMSQEDESSFNLKEEDAIRVNHHNNKDYFHKINLDENMLKQAQQNKKANLELGIEDFLDGDIVSYLFNENKNLMDINSYQGKNSS
jgi:[histone H3]-lysine4 N-trimethyltransferase MLL3